jgi:hypothetical protein
MATKANFVIDQGATFSIDVTVTDEDNLPFDLTGYSGRSQLRKHYTSSNSHSFTVQLGGNTGIINLSLTNTQSANIVAGRYVYDVEIFTANSVLRVIEGIATIAPEVTR